MTYYHQTKELALAAGKPYEDFFDVSANMTPYNGWVIKLIPKTVEVFKFPLFDLLKLVEIDMTGFNLVTIEPADRKRPAKLEREKPPAPPRSAPKAPPTPPKAPPPPSAGATPPAPPPMPKSAPVAPPPPPGRG